MKSTTKILKEVESKLTSKIIIDYLESNNQVKRTEGSTFKFIQPNIESKWLIQSTQPYRTTNWTEEGEKALIRMLTTIKPLRRPLNSTLQKLPFEVGITYPITPIDTGWLNKCKFKYKEDEFIINKPECFNMTITSITLQINDQGLYSIMK